MTETLAWPAIAARLAVELRERMRSPRPLGHPRQSRATWAVETSNLGELVVKVRHGDRADEKTRWCVANLPRLGERGYPVPEIVWRGLIQDDLHAVVLRRLPGEPLRSLKSPMLDALLALVELQADAGIAPDERDFAGYQSLVLFDGWDHVWRDAEGASPAAKALCERLRRWLQPVWGYRLAATDFVSNDLNLSNVLSDGVMITGVIDWDEFGLNSRAADLTALAFDCERLGDGDAADLLFARVVSIAGAEGLRCLVGCRVIGLLAALVRRGELGGVDTSVAVATRVLDRLEKVAR
jgi:Ser/Thr protein kinase RdoA (MazF antagonist)